jgi:hypothetical protein
MSEVPLSSHIILMVKAIRLHEKSVPTYETIRCLQKTAVWMFTSVKTSDLVLYDYQSDSVTPI